MKKERFSFLPKLGFTTSFSYTSFFFLLLFTTHFESNEKNKWCLAEIHIPAEYGEVEKRVLIPNGTKTVTEQVLVKKESTKIISILCDKDLTNHRLKRIKKALNRKGYALNDSLPLSADALLTSLKAFQKENNLSVGFYSLESLDALGINFWTLSIKRGKPHCYEKNLIQDHYKTVTETISVRGEKDRKITKRVLVEKGGYTRTLPCICEKDLTKKKIRKIKRQLKKKGYDVEKIEDTKYDPFKVALVRFQKDNNLPIGRVNIKTLDALDIK